MRASLYSLLCGLAAVRAADVALMVVEATGTTSSSYTSPVQSAFAGFGWVVTTRTASSTATGFVVEVPAQGSYDVAQLTEKLQTCAFRTTLEAAYEMAPWSLTDVSVTHACTAEEGVHTCATALASCDADGGGGGGDSGDSGDTDMGSGDDSDSDDSTMNAGVIVAIVTGVLAAIAIIALIVYALFGNMAIFGNGATAVPLSETPLVVAP